MDDPLWDYPLQSNVYGACVLIPLLVDDPLWVSKSDLLFSELEVLIPLLVDDPLWDFYYKHLEEW